MIKKLLQGPNRLWLAGCMAGCALMATTVTAQRPAARIRAEISDSQMSVLRGSQHPLAQGQFEAGRMSADAKLNGMSIVFNRSEAQQADLEALIAAQQDSASPLYHQWLSPEQFAARFGMAQSDIDKVQSWLQQQGFSIDSVARSKNLIRFSRHGGAGGTGVPDANALLQGRGREALCACRAPFYSFSDRGQCCNGWQSG